MKITLLVIGYAAVALAAKQYDPDAANHFNGFDEYEKPYQHDWENVPDLVNMPEIQFWFDITNAYLQGIERGTYGNSTYSNNPDCFGPKFVTRINQFAAMIKSPNLWWHIPYMIAIIYQMYFMIGDKCKIDNTVNDFFLYCWNKGCWPE